MPDDIVNEHLAHEMLELIDKIATAMGVGADDVPPAITDHLCVLYNNIVELEEQVKALSDRSGSA